ncbi:MAG: peptidoglycan editing factor PgeF [Burkholderiales bacterium]|nr:peptidoglycan editing factor PgeF [Burkholderiales bacterium]
MTPFDWITPDWPAPPRVRALVTTRSGGVSIGPYASLNLGIAVNDDPKAVAENRARVRAHLPEEPRWLKQVHGATVVAGESVSALVEADASVTRTPGVVCVIQMADCMPVLLATRDGSVIGIAHAGWRGLAGGVVERTIEAMRADPAAMIAWLGPAIGPNTFEVGDEVRAAFVAADPAAVDAFRPLKTGKWLADLFTLARQRLARAGLTAVHGGGLCTVSDPTRFFSHRRDRLTGRMGAFLWLEP